MSMPETRKLRRGLGDISPLFKEVLEAAKPSIEPPEPLLEVLSVISLESPGDSFLLNSFIASQIASAEKPCTLFSFQPTLFRKEPAQHDFLSGHVRRVNLAWEQFEKICRWPIHREFLESPFAQVLFFDAEPFGPSQFEKIVPLIDKFIFFLRPTYESMTETYKWMKAACHLNRQGTYFVLLEGGPEDKKGSYFFEKFSAMIAKHLSVQIYWLGYLNIGQRLEPIASALNLEHLFLEGCSNINSPEKIALAEYLHASSLLPQAIAL